MTQPQVQIKTPEGTAPFILPYLPAQLITVF